MFEQYKIQGLDVCAFILIDLDCIQINTCAMSHVHISRVISLRDS